MFGGETRSATAETLEDTSVVALLSSDMQRVMRASPQIALKMLAGLADRLRDANERLLQQSFQTVSGRVAGALLGQVVARQKEGDRTRPATSWSAPPRPRSPSWRGPRARAPAASWPPWSAKVSVALGRGKVTVHEPDRLRNYIH